MAALGIILAFGSSLAAQNRQMLVVQEKAPLFKEHSISSPIIKYLEKGSKLNLLAAEDSFYLVSFGGFEGWVIPYSVRELAAESGPADKTAARPAIPAQTSGRPGEAELGGYLVVKNRYANLREGPGLNYKTIAKAYQGQKLEKFIKRGNWYRVRLPNSEIGFIREDLVADYGGSGGGAGVAAAPVAPGAPLEDRVEHLEQELTELRALVLEHLRASGAMGQPGDTVTDKGGRLQGALTAPVVKPLSGLSQPVIQATGKIIGNRVTKVYHLPSSLFYDKIPEEFRVYFNTEEEARKAGYTKSIR